MTYYDPRKPKPWPVRILQKLGVESDETANKIIIFVSITFILISIYSSIKVTSPDIRDLPAEQFRELSS